MSQAQEIVQIYKKLKDLNNGLDIDDLIYGVDGFYYTNYPKHWNRVFSSIRGITAPVFVDAEPKFNGNPIYSQEFWNEVKNWAKISRGIELKDFIYNN